MPADSPLTSRTYPLETSDPAAAIEFCYEQGWTDGLPVVPPTPERVLEFCQAAGREPQEVLGYMEARQRLFTVEKVAVNAVMAGCRPEYFAVVLTAVEAMLEAGRDKECVDSSHWDAAHERHASAILRHYRHRLYHDVLERLPFYEVTKPEIDWDERARIVSSLLSARVS
ncbi:MAG: hypothetical protein IIB21_07675 [Chloroflexi bacterium]|nr:hypothetical protein [Chloroflexota bacterium]